jgi:hypothetical protein
MLICRFPLHREVKLAAMHDDVTISALVTELLSSYLVLRREATPNRRRRASDWSTVRASDWNAVSCVSSAAVVSS